MKLRKKATDARHRQSHITGCFGVGFLQGTQKKKKTHIHPSLSASFLNPFHQPTDVAQKLVRKPRMKGTVSPIIYCRMFWSRLLAGNAEEEDTQSYTLFLISLVSQPISPADGRRTEARKKAMDERHRQSHITGCFGVGFLQGTQKKKKKTHSHIPFLISLFSQSISPADGLLR